MPSQAKPIAMNYLTQTNYQKKQDEGLNNSMLNSACRGYFSNDECEKTADGKQIVISPPKSGDFKKTCKHSFSSEDQSEVKRA